MNFDSVGYGPEKASKNREERIRFERLPELSEDGLLGIDAKVQSQLHPLLFRFHGWRI